MNRRIMVAVMAIALIITVVIVLESELRDMNKATTNTNVITLHSIIRVPFIRYVIFNQVYLLSREIEKIGTNTTTTTTINKVTTTTTTCTSMRGEDIRQLRGLGMISKYAMPWDYIKHYLSSPEMDKGGILFERRMHTITSYCGHPNATLETLKHLLEWSPDYYPFKAGQTKEDTPLYYQNLLSSIARAKHSDILDLMITRYPNQYNTKEAMVYATKNGLLSTVQLLLNHTTMVKDGNLPEKVIDIAALSGHLGIVTLLHNYSIKHQQDLVKKMASKNAMNFASTHGYLDVLQFLHENRTEGCLTLAMDEAAKNGHFEVVKFLHYNRTEGCTSYAIDLAKTLEIVTFLHQNRTEGATARAMDNAAMNGALDILTFLHNHRTEGATTSAIDLASENGHLHCIKFLKENRSEGCTLDAMEVSIRNNHSLDITKYIYDNLNKEVTVRSSIYAIEHGRLDVIQFLHQRYEPNEIYRLYTMDTSSHYGRFDILKFFHENTKERCTTRSMNNAARLGSLDTVKYLHYNRTEGCTFNALDYACEGGFIDIVKFLHENRTEGFVILESKFLHYNRTEGCTTEAIGYASIYGRIDIVQFLHENRTEGTTFRALLVTDDTPNHYQCVDYLLKNNIVSKQMVMDNETEITQYLSLKGGLQSIPSSSSSIYIYLYKIKCREIFEYRNQIIFK
ncbi:hypothetical protein DFA_04951 [Cavenderia fasciculata]|uniref:Ankyrin repeat-containing protein n=1 Tax=Cavenderia fasciculata TaxID=261658 RepID=F4PMM4_CACFS|nr:uncharacterized protein DFA_04951 [Cavenderia fasciculata]EGG22821.1 hypothetical protein DFA_04951 [Cavenderia fasciculata]|eukprot:XP_004360672.1 hypothetical protein DFA_04951 [Cavenderia fasciculata]